MFSEYPATKILVELSRNSLTPAILFRTSRRQCDNDIENLTDARIGQLAPEEQKDLRAEVQNVCEKYSFDPDGLTTHVHYQSLVRTGAGAHHAGQLLMWRLLLEELMSRGQLRLLIATGTVAAGVDFPARSVVITAHSKRGSEGFNVLTSAEFQQMSGRAGRRGRDAVGFCLVAPSRFCDARVIHDVTKRPPEPLSSAYFASPSTVLNLLKFRNVDDLRYTVSRSLAAFLDRKGAAAIRADADDMKQELDGVHKLGAEARKKLEKRIRRRLREADELEQRQQTQLEATLQGLERLGHLEGNGLTKKGYWAAELCTTLVLELAEAVERGIFYELSPLHLAGMVASIAGDSHRTYFALRANPIPNKLYQDFQECLEHVQTAYPRAFAADLKVIPEAALTIMTWINCQSWREFAGLLRLGGVAEGDVARLVTQSADHLNQLGKLYDTHTELARAAIEARKLLLKPPLSEGLLSD